MSEEPELRNTTSNAEPVPFGSAQSLKSSSSVEPEHLRNEQASAEERREVMIARSFLRHHSGPLPAPETLAEYEKILPGAAERIFVRFEKQSDHRMVMEKKVIDSNTFSQRWSTVLASAVALLVALGALFLAHEGKSVTGLSVFFGTLFSFLGTYVLGKKFQAEERREKDDAAQEIDQSDAE